MAVDSEEARQERAESLPCRDPNCVSPDPVSCREKTTCVAPSVAHIEADTLLHPFVEGEERHGVPVYVLVAEGSMAVVLRDVIDMAINAARGVLELDKKQDQAALEEFLQLVGGGKLESVDDLLREVLSVEGDLDDGSVTDIPEADL